MFLVEALTGLRRLTGVDKEEVTDEEAKEMLPLVLRSVDKVCSRLTKHTLILVPGQSNYPLPDPNIQSVTSHSYMQSQVRYGDSSHEVRQPRYDAGVGAHQFILRNYESGLDQEVSSITVQGGMIHVEPTPTQSENVAIRAHSGWDFHHRVEYTGDGAQLDFELDHRRPFNLSVVDAGEELEADEFSLISGRPAIVRCVVAPSLGASLVVAYHTSQAFEQVPMHMRHGFERLWAACVARVAGQQRAHQPEMNFSGTKIKTSGKGLLAMANMLEKEGLSSLNTELGRGVIIQ